ncbi:hypothetical protein DM02DRAFT_654943 [Periconia macrospinosa]|uniref:Uncharacterized protein n=1 Tax=Periconia macrospinosa TaxID=97972 RepID=A0A2V1DUW5_9PLEO|nr:hypothetical protein DM02DRAFT_654943 [Periconia macrospinosa]
MQGIFNLIAQRNQQISIALAQESAKLAYQSTRIAADSRVLAKESKRDSTSMKAIAAVTMFFLPGTAVATLFAMPLFKWDSETGSVVNNHLWIYWAVTVPLTLLTFIVWRTWNWGASRLYKRQQETL